MALWRGLHGAWGDLGMWGQIPMALWVLALIALPILKWIWGDRALRWGTVLGVTLQAFVVWAALSRAWGWPRGSLVALAIVCMGWAVEFVGSRTGYPFGRYRYTDRLRPQIGHVPLAVPLAWLMMLPPAWAIADWATGGRGLAFVAISALAFTAWDLYLDPQMVGWRFWTWEHRGGYFGIPWVNYLGWMLASGAMTAILRPAFLPTGPLGLVYGITWLMETIALGVFWQQRGPAACGFVGMGGMLLWAWLGSR
jgi:uncharacterized membrane protein